MTLTPDQARQRLAKARNMIALPATLAHGREGFDVNAMRTMAIVELINFLEDALA